MRGGHAIREHVGKTDAELVGRLERERWDLWVIEFGRRRAGSFFSLQEANVDPEQRKIMSAEL